MYASLWIVIIIPAIGHLFAYIVNFQTRSKRLSALDTSPDWRGELSNVARQLLALASQDEAPIWGVLLTRSAHGRDTEAAQRHGYVQVPGNEIPMPYYAAKERAAMLKSDTQSIAKYGAQILLNEDARAAFEQYKRDLDASEHEVAAELERELSPAAAEFAEHMRQPA